MTLFLGSGSDGTTSLFTVCRQGLWSQPNYRDDSPGDTAEIGLAAPSAEPSPPAL